MAAWADEVGAQPLARTLLDEPIVIFRETSGAPRALFDRCPHRFAPLSLGSLADGALTCRYHGLSFDGAGACVGNPHGPLSRSLAVRSYPIAEAHKALWIWMGDAALADASTIRNLDFLSAAPHTAFNKGYVLGRGAYQLYVDNILDLSHTDFLHPTTLGGGSITRTQATVEERDDGAVAIHWHSFDEVPVPLIRERLPAGVDRVDSWTEVEWSAPGVMKLVSGAVPAGTRRSAGGNAVNVHIMTPETSATTHYFFASTRDYALNDAELNERIRQVRAEIFSTEDEPMIAAQQERIGDRDFWSLRPRLMRIDEGAAKVRRRMEAMITSEATREADADLPVRSTTAPPDRARKSDELGAAEITGPTQN